MRDDDGKKVIQNLIAPNAISVGVTWVSGKILFKHNKKYSQFYYGMCHYSKLIFAVTPLDYERPTMITTIAVSPFDKYCERSDTCLNIDCKLNRFDKNAFITEFKDCGEFSLSLPSDFGLKTPWFNDGQWKEFWGKFQLDVAGGVLRFDEDKK